MSIIQLTKDINGSPRNLARFLRDSSGNPIAVADPSTGFPFLKSQANTCVLMGNSFDDRAGCGNGLTTCSVTGTYSLQNLDGAWFSWFNAFTKQEFQLLYNGGYSAQTSAQILARMPVALSYQPGWVIFGSTAKNDYGIYTAAQSAANCQAMITQAISQGCRVIFNSEVPRNDGSIVQNLFFAKVNDLMRQWCNNNKQVLFYDAWQLFVGPTDAAGFAKSNYLLGDSLHPAPKGARAWGAGVAALVTGQYVPTNRHVSSIIDCFANDSANKQLVPNPLFQGTGGFKYGAATGTVATGFGAGIGAGSPTVVCSVNARTLVNDGDAIGNNQRIVITAAAAGDAGIISVNPFHGSSALNPGDFFYLESFVSLRSITNLKQLHMQGTITAGGTQITSQFMQTNGATVNDVDQTDIVGIVMRTGIMQVPSGTVTSSGGYVDVQFYGSGGATLDVGRMAAYKI